MIEFKPDINGEIIVYNAFENGSQTGRITALIKGAECTVRLIEAVDDETAEGLIRSALNAAANRMGYIAIYECDSFTSVAELLGFKVEGGRLTGEIPTLLAGCCGCKGC